MMIDRLRNLLRSRAFLWLSRLGLLIVLCTITILSILPNDSIPTSNISDKVSHFIAYAVLAVGLGLSFPVMTALRLVVYCTLFGIGIEIVQLVMGQGRTFSVLDILANFAGAALGAIVIGSFYRRWVVPNIGDS